MPNFTEFINALMPGDANRRINELLRRNKKREADLLPSSLKRVVIILEGENLEETLGQEAEAKRDPFDSLPPRLPRGPGFQT